MSSYIFDQDVTAANWDPDGIGAPVWAGIKHSDVNAANVTLPINRGDVIDGQYLYPCGAAFRGDASGLYADDCVAATSLPGQWVCLGFIDQRPGANYNLDIAFSATNWMRVG